MFFFFNDTATTEIYTLSLHDALPISLGASRFRLATKHLLPNSLGPIIVNLMFTIPSAIFFEAFLSFIGLGIQPPEASLGALINDGYTDRKSTRLNSSHANISYAVFCL